MAEAVYCPNCGIKVRTGHQRCPKCGEELPREVPTAARVATDPASGPGPARTAAIALGVLLAAVALAVFWPREAPDDRAVPVERAVSRAPAPAPPPPEPATADEPAHVDPPFLTVSGSGKLLYTRGDYEGALQAFEEAIERNPDDAESYSNLGQVLVRMGRAEEAIPHFERAVTIIPDRWAYHFNLARAAGELGDWERAVAEYRVAQGLFPDDYVTEYNLARALHKLGDEQAAVDGYLRAIALAPEDATFRLSLGISYEQLGRKAEAAAAYGAYLELAPDAADADRVRARITLLTGATEEAVPARPAGSDP